MRRAALASLLVLVACDGVDKLTDDDLDVSIGGDAPRGSQADEGDAPAVEADGEGTGAGDGGGAADGGDAGDGGDDGDAGGADGDDGTTTTDADVEALYGDWLLRRMERVDDTCPWMEAGLATYGFTLDAFYPSEFVVNPVAGGFEIEAWNYGADGPILCRLDGPRFTCDEQQVAPIIDDLGGTGWLYAIEFSGVLEAEDALTGTAVVRYPSVDPTVSDLLDAYGYDPTDCVQTFNLRLGYGY